MTFRTVASLLATGLAPFVLVYGVGRFSRYLAARRDPIDDLIGANRATWCDGVDRDGVDLSKPNQRQTERAGEQRWQETLRAQRRSRKPADPRIVPFEERRRRA